MSSYGRTRSKARRNLRIAAGAAIAALVILVALAIFRVGHEPAVSIEPGMPGLGAATPIAIVIEEDQRGVGEVQAELVQGDLVVPIGAVEHPQRPFWALWGPRTPSARIEAVVGRDSVEGLEEGNATIRVTAERAGTWLRRPEPVVAEAELPVRFRPPAIAVLSAFIYAAQGGSEAVVYRVGEHAAIHGVRAGDAWFPGSPLPGGAPDERFVLFGIPYDLEDFAKIRLVVADDLGNEAAIPFLDRFTPKPYRRSTISLSDEFLQKVVPGIVAQTPGIEEGDTLLETYLWINGELRQRNSAHLLELGGRSAEELFIRRPFVQQPNSQVMDQFAAARTYRYGGETVDQQVHLGYDLASTRRAPVAAANRGRVLLAEYFGIYGNTVVLDHGYGLMSLYAHLSSIDVEPQQMVELGQSLGRTGETGLAGGDHLHFTVLVRGVPVNPDEWLDGAWIRNRIAAKLGPAFPFEE
ncbi:MAG TPA: M23 family metallopeptidase [Thermoanaerobaculia bacterium]|nr:M23 family metallopeptidase [Thermoanaerobaculia bacterium]